MVNPRNRADDVLIVGRGIYALVCAALLERERMPGGYIRADELALPGLQHDKQSIATAHPQFLVETAYAALGKALHEANLQYCNTDSPTGMLLLDGRHLVLSTSRETNLQRFDACHPGDGAAYDATLDEVATQALLVFSLLGNELWRLGTVHALASAAWKQGPRALSAFFGQALTPARAWLSQAFRSDLLGTLLAPWVRHCDLVPEAPLSALMAKVVAFPLEAVGMPLVQGGNANAVRPCERLIRDADGELENGADAERVLVERGHAVGVRLADGREFRARDVIFNVTPTQLYQRLLEPQQVPAEIGQQAHRWRYGKGNLQIRLAVPEPPQSPDLALDRVSDLHLTGGGDAVSRAVNEAERGLLPTEPTICVAQPTAPDHSRAPDGHHILWIQLPGCPREPVGDAAGLIEVPTGGRWATALREAYVDRVIERLARQVPTPQSSLLARAVLPPTVLQDLNMNIVGGDPYGGDCSLDPSRPRTGRCLSVPDDFFTVSR